MLEVEALMTAKAIELARDIGIFNAILKGNLVTIISSLKTEEISFAPYGHLIADV